MKPANEKPISPQEKAPALVLILGYGGLIPFVLTVLGQGLGFFSELINWAFLALAYGAVILSFVGALHWAFAMTMTEMEETQRQSAYLWSVMPALLGFLALALPLAYGYAILVIGFVFAYWKDRVLARQVRLPGWYLTLRARLSGVACLALVAAMILVSA